MIPAAEKAKGFKIPKDAVLKDGYYRGRIDFIGHLIGCMSFLGGILVAFFGGIGLVSVPYDLIYEYVYMPQPMASEEQFNSRKLMLLNYSLKLRAMGKALENERGIVAEIKGSNGWKRRSVFAKKMRILESRALRAEKEYSILEMEANYYQMVEPLTYTFKLVLGILAALLSLNWVVQL